MLSRLPPRRLAIGQCRRGCGRRGGRYRGALQCQNKCPAEGVAQRGAHLHDSRSVVCDGLPAILVHHQEVAAIGPEGRLDRCLNSEAGVDVGDDLALALRGVGSCKGVWSEGGRRACASKRGARRGGGFMEGLRTLFQDDDCWGLASERHVGWLEGGGWKSRSWGEALGRSRGRVGGVFVVGVGRRWGWIRCSAELPKKY